MTATYKIRRGRHHPKRMWYAKSYKVEIWLDCIDCDKSIGLEGKDFDVLRRMSNAEAQAIFEDQGWTVKPTRCPDCAAKSCLKKEPGRIPKDLLENLRSLAVAYYEARYALEVKYLDPWIDPATYTTDGVLDVEAYRQALVDMEAYTEEPEMKAIAKTPTAMEPHNVWAVQMFGGHNFEARRRLRISVKQMEDTNLCPICGKPFESSRPTKWGGTEFHHAGDPKNIVCQQSSTSAANIVKGENTDGKDN